MWHSFLHSLKIFNKGSILPAPLNFYIRWRSSLMMMMMMMLMMMMMMMMMMLMLMLMMMMLMMIQHVLPRLQLIQRRRANRRGQDEVFGRNYTIVRVIIILWLYYIILPIVCYSTPVAWCCVSKSPGMSNVRNIQTWTSWTSWTSSQASWYS